MKFNFMMNFLWNYYEPFHSMASSNYIVIGFFCCCSSILHCKWFCLLKFSHIFNENSTENDLQIFNQQWVTFWKFKFECSCLQMQKNFLINWNSKIEMILMKAPGHFIRFTLLLSLNRCAKLIIYPSSIFIATTTKSKGKLQLEQHSSSFEWT